MDTADLHEAKAWQKFPLFTGWGMDKQAVEANDLRFQQKVGELRSNLTDRQQTYQRKRKVSLGIKVLAPLLLAAVGYYVTRNTAFRDQLSPSVAPVKQEISATVPQTPLNVTLPSPARGKSAATSRANTPEPPTADIPEASLSVKTLPPVVEVGKALSSTETPAPAVAPTEILLPADVPTPDVAPLEIPKTAVVAVAGPEPSSPAPPPLAHIRIAQRLACLGVEARQCIGAQSVFTLNQHNNPHIWMDVRSQSLPYVLKHVYYHEGRKYSEIPLAIKYPRMRTWSNVTLQSPIHVGSWRVEIATEDGTVLDQVMFHVTP